MPRIPRNKKRKGGGSYIVTVNYRIGELSNVAMRAGIDICPKQPEKSRAALSYHGRVLSNIICTDCGFQHIKQVVNGRCVDEKKCADRKRLWR
jgi:hypothetical protein